jgi:dolichol-phosphate mannosyltransferase
MKLSIIVPCFNEAENISKLHNELLPVIKDLVAGWNNAGDNPGSAEMIFVDDGSRDETSEKLRGHFEVEGNSFLSFKFLRHATNLGLGAAIRTGFAGAEGDVILTVDSDGTYKFSAIPALLSMLTPGVDIVTASPYHPKGGVIGVPANRLILSQGSSILYRILVDRHIHTYTSLFRAYRSDVVKAITFKSNDFLAGTELLVGAILRGYRVVEFPSVLHKRMYGVSKARIARTIVSHLKFQVSIILNHLRVLLGRNPKLI